jgi:hypothetical protein
LTSTHLDDSPDRTSAHLDNSPQGLPEAHVIKKHLTPKSKEHTKEEKEERGE